MTLWGTMTDQPVGLARAIGREAPILLDPMRLDEFALLWLAPAFAPAQPEATPGARRRPRRTVH